MPTFDRRAFIGAFGAPAVAASSRQDNGGPSLPTGLSPKAFGARGDGIMNDTAAFERCFAECAVSKQPMLIPPGEFLVEPLSWDRYVQVTGAGPSHTILRALAPHMPVVTIYDRDALGRDPYARSYTTHYSHFAIDGNGRAGATGLRSRASIAGSVSTISIRNCEVGLSCEGTQYSVFDQVFAQHCDIGLRLTDDRDGRLGGGINNEFRSLTAYSCRVGVMIGRTKMPFPMGINRFTNLKSQDNSLCALYMYGQSSTYVSEFAPEDNGRGDADAAVIDGLLVKRSAVHGVRSAAIFECYDHEQRQLPILAEDESSLSFRGVTGAAVIARADGSSVLNMEGEFGNGSSIENGLVAMRNRRSYRSFLATSPGIGRVDPTFINEAPSPTCPAAKALGLTAIDAVSDRGLGLVRRIRFGGAASSGQRNAVAVTTRLSAYPPQTDMFLAFLAWSDRNASLALDFAETAVTGTIRLTAGRWTRVLLKNFNEAARPRAPQLVISTVDVEHCELRITRMISATTLSAAEVYILCTDHPFNPKI